MKELIKLWEQFENETKEFRKVDARFQQGDKPQYFKGDFYDFMMWLRERIKNLPNK